MLHEHVQMAGRTGSICTGAVTVVLDHPGRWGLIAHRRQGLWTLSVQLPGPLSLHIRLCFRRQCLRPLLWANCQLCRHAHMHRLRCHMYTCNYMHKGACTQRQVQVTGCLVTAVLLSTCLMADVAKTGIAEMSRSMYSK